MTQEPDTTTSDGEESLSLSDLPQPETETTLPPGDLRVDGENPNHMNEETYRLLVDKIRERGWLGAPIITDTSGLIVDGEHRWRAAQELDLTEVPVRQYDLTDAERRLIRQELNKLQGEHDPREDAYEYDLLMEEGYQDELETLTQARGEDLDELLDSLWSDPGDDLQDLADDPAQTASDPGSDGGDDGGTSSGVFGANDPHQLWDEYGTADYENTDEFPDHQFTMYVETTEDLEALGELIEQEIKPDQSRVYYPSEPDVTFMDGEYIDTAEPANETGGESGATIARGVTTDSPPTRELDLADIRRTLWWGRQDEYVNRTEAWLQDRWQELHDLGYEYPREFDLDYWRTRTREAWEAHDPGSNQEMHEFYETHEDYIPELSIWTFKGDKIGQIRQVHEWALEYAPGTRLLDYGAGIGDMVLALHSLGYTVTYCDVDGPGSQFFRERTDARGRDIPQVHIPEHDSTLATQTSTDEAWDVIVSNDVLEHVTQPLDHLTAFHDRLNEGGLLITQWTFNDHEGEDDYTPCHIQSGPEVSQEVTSHLRDLGFQEQDSTWNKTLRLWQKQGQEQQKGD